MDAGGHPSGTAPLRTAVATPAGVAGVLAATVFVLFVARDAGYPVTVWSLGALFLLGLIGITVAVARPAFRRPALGAIVCLAAFTAWSYASIAWSSVKGDAWDGANRTFLYLVVYALFAALPWPTEAAAFVVCGYAFATVAVGVGTFVAASSAVDPDAYFIGGRFSEPMGYQNANAAIFLFAFWPLLTLAARREAPPVLRGLALAAGGVALELALLTQARALVVAVPVATVVYLIVVPGRLRALLALLVMAATVAAAAPTLLDVFPAVRAEGAHDALDRAVWAVALSGLALAVGGWLWGTIDRRVEIRPRVTRVLGRGAVAAAALASLIAVIVVLASNPVAAAREAWTDFRRLDPPATSSNYALGFSSNRYDVWRVAWAEFRASPLHGIGADNFGVQYVLRRRGLEETLYPHSLELRTLTQLGVVGGVLLCSFFAFAVVDVFRRRFADARARAFAGTAFVVFTYWFVHGSVDWFWEIPALTCPALAFLGLAGGLGREGTSARRVNSAAAAAVCAAAIAGAVSVVFPWLAEKEIQQAARQWRTNANDAFARVERARRLNPLSDKPDMVAGAIASRVDDVARMELAFERVLARNPHNWYAHFELALVAAARDDRAVAFRRLEAARRLNPREPAIALARGQIESGEEINRDEYDRLFVRRAEAIVE